MNWRNWFAATRPSHDIDIPPPNPKFFGSIIAAVGQPGTGKTYKLVRLAYKSAWVNGLPLIVQDTNGEVTIYHEKLIKGFEGKTDTLSQKKLEWLKSTSHVRIFNQNETDWFQAKFKAYERKARKAKIRVPEVVFLIEEGGKLRHDQEDFWSLARKFRNIGAHCYTSIHKDTDITRSGRQCLRVVILDRPYEKEIEFFGVTIPAMECSPPMSDDVTFIDSYSREIQHFNMVTEWDNIPDVLIAPVQPTNVDSITF